MTPEIAALADALAQLLSLESAHVRAAALARAAERHPQAPSNRAVLALPLPAAVEIENLSDPDFANVPDSTSEDAGSLLLGLALGPEDPYIDLRLDPPGGGDANGEICIVRRPGRFDVEIFDGQGEHVLTATLDDTGKVHLHS